MATLTNGAGPAVNLDTLNIGTWLNGAPFQPAPDLFSIAADAGLTIEYRGRGFTFGNGNTTVTGGSIELIDVRLNGELWMQIDLDAPMTVQTLRSFVTTGNEQGFLARVLAGNDTISRPENAADGAAVLFDGFAGNDSITGGRGGDTLRGGIGNDTLNGGTGADSMLGGAGNDTYVVDNAGDVVDETGGSGIDTVVVQAGSLNLAATVGAIENVVVAGSLGISVDGNALGNKIAGNGAGNTLRGFDGNDSIGGGGGDDWLEGGNGRDTLIGGDGVDVLIGSNPNGIAPVGDDRDVLSGGGGNDHYFIGENDDGDTVIESAGGGTDTVEYAGRLGRYTLGANVENLELRDGIDRNGTGNSLANDLRGNNSQNQLAGLAGNDTLSGLAGNDTLDGGAGDDSMQGGGGADLYIVDSKLDIVDEAGGNSVDTVRSSVSFDLSSQTKGQVENVILTGMAALNATGDALDNFLTGNAGRNVLTGLAGSDVLDGGAGVDTLRGGTGSDTYVLDSLADVFEETGVDAEDTVVANFSVDLTSVRFAAIEFVWLTGNGALNATGTDAANDFVGNAGANKLIGNGGDDTLTGGAGNDTLDGGGGKDTLIGGLGNDTYVVDDVGDQIRNELTGLAGGRDAVRSSVSFDLNGANFAVEDLVLTGDQAIDGTGNDQNNLIQGNDKDNALSGQTGNDTLNGGAGNDTLSAAFAGVGGGGGKDVLNGGAGNDVYLIADGDTVIESIAGAAGGTDTVRYSEQAGYTLGANVEELVLVNGAAFGTGNALNNRITGSGKDERLSGLVGNDTIIGSGGDDVIDGGAGADSMVGGTGSEIFIVDDVGDIVDNRAGGGVVAPALVHSSISFNLTDNGATVLGELLDLVLTGSKAINGTGNALNNRITGNGAANILDGGFGDDIVLGGAGNDKLLGGGGGFDNLNGGVGADTMEGGDGNDRYFVDNVKDVVVETNGDPLQEDRVDASVSYTLSANVENLRLTGSAVVGTGNGSANDIEGTAAANKLSGLGGDDAIFGFGGNDLLDGGVGDDSMAGGEGNDTYHVDSTKDTLTELIGEGIDTVIATVGGYGLAANIENLTLAAGTGDIDGFGNDLANLIIGNEGNNLLSGDDGADMLIGGVGRDTLFGGAGNDKLDGGVGDDRLAGGAGDDTLTGGAGFDIFFHNAATDGHDLIMGFDGNAAGGQDFLDLDALFDNLGIAADVRASRVTLTDRGSSVEVRIDTNGNGDPDLHIATLMTADVITAGAAGADILLGT